MEHTTYIKYLKVSPKKLRFIVDAVKKMKPTKAIQALAYDNTIAAHVLYKTVKSAIDSAKNTLKIDENLLQFKVLAVEEGPAFKRSRPGGRGTVKPFKRPSSHVKIILTIETSKVNTKKEDAPVIKEVTEVDAAPKKKVIRKAEPVKKVKEIKNSKKVAK